jgi:putative NADH-flavin reductase
MIGMRIAVIGASGWLGGAIAREALARGHEVTAIGRDRGRREPARRRRPPLRRRTRFPEAYKPEALAQAEALGALRAAPAELDWTYLSPPPHNLVNGEKRGGYEVHVDDRPVVDATGESAIASGDLAAAMVDELEAPQFARRRFTAAYAP